MRQTHFRNVSSDSTTNGQNGFQLDFGAGRQYKPLPQKKVETRPAAVEYMESRGISRAITEEYKIIVQTKNPHVLVFPFYDENNVISNVFAVFILLFMPVTQGGNIILLAVLVWAVLHLVYFFFVLFSMFRI